MTSSRPSWRRYSSISSPPPPPPPPPAAPPGPGPAGRQLRRGGGRTRQGRLHHGGLRHLPRAAPLHRAGLEPPHAGGDRHRLLPGRPLAGRPLPHHAAQGALVAQQGGLLPRRPLRHPARRRRPLRRALRAAPDRGAEGGSGGVFEVAVGRAVFPRDLCPLGRPALRSLTPWPPLHFVERGNLSSAPCRAQQYLPTRALPLHEVERDRG